MVVVHASNLYTGDIMTMFNQCNKSLEHRDAWGIGCSQVLYTLSLYKIIGGVRVSGDTLQLFDNNIKLSTR